MERKILAALTEWKNSSDRKPLLLDGARQVGKTYILREFGSRCFSDCVYFHLESNRHVKSLFEENMPVSKLLSYLEAEARQKITPEKTLIIFDEIQACPSAIASLKYFCEDAPEYYVCAAGSLLGVAINRTGVSFPVGKVKTVQLYPMDFEEFLMAIGEDQLLNTIKTCSIKKEPMPEALHIKALQLYREYLVIGGMPEAVKCYTETHSFLDVSVIQTEILDNYVADMAKYATSQESVKIRACYDSLPSQLAKDNKKFQYKVVQKGGTASLFGVALDWLLGAGIIYKCFRVEQGEEPLEAHKDLSCFKVYMSDVGLLTNKSGITPTVILAQEENGFIGAITENYIATQLVVQGMKLYYWATPDSQAELDFLSMDGGVCAMEVKAGSRVRSRSLYAFIKKYHPKRAIRFSAKNFGWEDGIDSIPLYAVFTIKPDTQSEK